MYRVVYLIPTPFVDYKVIRLKLYVLLIFYIGG